MFGPRRRACACFSVKSVVLGITLVCLSEAVRADWKSLTALEHDGARISASAIDLDNGTLIQQLNASTRLTPASLTKLITAAAALQQWPADRMFRTTLLANGEIRNSTLSGDLILRSAGDPSLDDNSLWALAGQLKGYDITSVTGGLSVSLSPFGPVPCGTKDRCDAQLVSERSYNAPIAALSIDFGSWCIVVRPTQAGSRAQVRGCAVAHLPIPINGDVKTLAAGSRTTLWVERSSSEHGDALRVGGGVPLGGEERVWRAMSNSPQGVGLLLVEALRELGIAINGPVRVTEQPPPDNARELAATEGLTLREQLGRMLRFSNNYIADVLTMDLAASSASLAPSDLGTAANSLTQFMSALPRSTSAVEQQPLQLLSGSGLTVENRLSADDLTAVLSYQYHNSGHFPAFYGGLTVPREAPFEFMRKGNDAWLDRVALKTGTLNDPVSVCGVAGYLRKRDGGWIAFAAIVNGSQNRAHIPLDTAMRAIQTDVEEILSRY
jgi:D-alanyl-D-alanine carboxypeptidase/D-alanyl-D-alanine-endopeptidase (penicillin-binding protein 4)